MSYPVCFLCYAPFLCAAHRYLAGEESLSSNCEPMSSHCLHSLHAGNLSECLQFPQTGDNSPRFFLIMRAAFPNFSSKSSNHRSNSEVLMHPPIAKSLSSAVELSSVVYIISQLLLLVQRFFAFFELMTTDWTLSSMPVGLGLPYTGIDNRLLGVHACQGRLLAANPSSEWCHPTRGVASSSGCPARSSTRIE